MKRARKPWSSSRRSSAPSATASTLLKPSALIREGVTDQHELFARHIVLIRPGSLPKTTSGKIQRGLARKLWLERRLDELTSGAD